MARGFDSKFVEAQQEEAARAKVVRPSMTPEQRERAARRESLLLSRARAEAELARATAEPHRRMLEHAIRALEEQLAALQG